MEHLQVKFYGIDSWGRPVFMATNREKYFIGDTGHLFRSYATEKDVLDFYKEADLTEMLIYLGSSFDCEPEGGSLHGMTIEIIAATATEQET